MHPRSTVAIAALMLFATPVAAQQAEPPAGEPPAGDAAPESPRRHRLAIAASYGVGVEINASVEIDVASLWVRWTRVLGGEDLASSERTFLGGQPAVGLEVTPVTTFDQPGAAWGAGWHLIYEHRLRSSRPLRPLLRFGAGMLFTNNRVPPGETRYNFSLFAGAGLEIDVGTRTALQVDYRLHHVSNADTGPRNPGINAHTLVLGVVRSF